MRLNRVLASSYHSFTRSLPLPCFVFEKTSKVPLSVYKGRTMERPLALTATFDTLICNRIICLVALSRQSAQGLCGVSVCVSVCCVYVRVSVYQWLGGLWVGCAHAGLEIYLFPISPYRCPPNILLLFLHVYSPLRGRPLPV